MKTYRKDDRWQLPRRLKHGWRIALLGVGMVGLVLGLRACHGSMTDGDESGKSQTESDKAGRGQIALMQIWDAVNDLFLPVVSASGTGAGFGEWIIQGQVETILPLYGILERKDNWERGADGEARRPVEGLYEDTYAENEKLDGTEAGEGLSGQTGGMGTGEGLAGQTGGMGTGEGLPGQADGTSVGMDGLFFDADHGQIEGRDGAYSDFTPHARGQAVDLAKYEDFEALIKDFYTVDANTMVGSAQLDIEKLSGMDLTIQKADAGVGSADEGGEDVEPQILIYHTHSLEAYADSLAGDKASSVVGVGERLAQILREDYGYGVLHCTEGFDLESRADAYNRALPVIEQILEENPSIQVVIDLHRDEMPVGTRLVTELDGKPAARFMFFNGLSRTRETGEISYLKNENLDGNLAFSFQMQLKCMEYYPRITRKIYLKGYRYNMHLKPRSLLVEMGAQNNTLEEAMNSCGPLAHVLHMVLSGAE